MRIQSEDLGVFEDRRTGGKQLWGGWSEAGRERGRNRRGREELPHIEEEHGRDYNVPILLIYSWTWWTVHCFPSDPGPKQRYPEVLRMVTLGYGVV